MGRTGKQIILETTTNAGEVATAILVTRFVDKLEEALEKGTNYLSKRVFDDDEDENENRQFQESSEMPGLYLSTIRNIPIATEIKARTYDPDEDEATTDTMKPQQVSSLPPIYDDDDGFPDAVNTDGDDLYDTFTVRSDTKNRNGVDYDDDLDDKPDVYDNDGDGTLDTFVVNNNNFKKQQDKQITGDGAERERLNPIDYSDDDDDTPDAWDNDGDGKADEFEVETDPRVNRNGIDFDNDGVVDAFDNDGDGKYRTFTINAENSLDVPRGSSQKNKIKNVKAFNILAPKQPWIWKEQAINNEYPLLSLECGESKPTTTYPVINVDGHVIGENAINAMIGNELRPRIRKAVNKIINKL